VKSEFVNHPAPFIWTTPSRDSSGSMPLGNGDIGLNVWVEEDGDLLFYLSKTDAWDENAQLLKLGRIRVTLTPNPFVAGATFRQELDQAAGCIRISAEVNSHQSSVTGPPITDHRSLVTLLLWVDANRPVVHVAIDGDRPFELRVALELWRTTDHIVEGSGDVVVWCHRNVASCWQATLEQQHMGAWVKEGHDPLLNRTFGALLRGGGLVKDGETGLRTATPQSRIVCSIHPLTAQTASLGAWVSAVTAQASASDAVPLATAFAEHEAWWRAFWDRSWIHVSGTPEAETVSRGYALQRFINACGGRGAFPIKFNGSIFTVDAREGTRDGYGDENRDADYRRWGGAYWFQNTRLTYWPMITSGDFDLMEPWFRMYLDALPFAMARAKANFGLEGAAMFPETMHFWGAFLNENYGSNRGDLPPGLTENLYIRRYWQGMLELLAVLLDAYAVSGDENLLRDKLLVLAPPFLRFYRDYYSHLDEHGKMLLSPSQSLETWWDTVNPLPDIAGLHWVLDGLLALPSAAVPAALRQEWEALRAILPPVPTRTYLGQKKLLIPALQYDGCHNCENPELYAIFPYRLYGVGRPDLETGRRTFAARQFKGTGGWQQDAIQAALLGLTDEARAAVVSNFSTSHKGSRFPAFWGPNFDWIPDQDHGAVACIALQQMLLQCDRADASTGRGEGAASTVDATPPSRSGVKPSGEGAASTNMAEAMPHGAIRLLPAWPREWNVDFRLHAPGQTVVEGRVEQGRLCEFRITPETRRRDVVVSDYNDPVSWLVSRVVEKPAGGVAAAVIPVTVDATPPSRESELKSGGGAASTSNVDVAFNVDATPPSRRAIPDLAWALVQPDPSGFLNLHDRCGETDGLVYLANRFDAPFAGRWQLSLGHDGGVRVFADGVPVLCAPETCNPAKPDRSTVELALTAGVHEIVIAFDLAGGNGWGIFFGWAIPDGEQSGAVQRVYPRLYFPRLRGLDCRDYIEGTQVS
jgi:alpha-L-fucosidase 2